MYMFLLNSPKIMSMASSSGTSGGSYNSPCAACKFLRRKCLPGCIFAPYFPPEEPQKFANVHKIFGASNVTKLLNELLPHQREDAVNSLAYEAEARVRDPVYGCVGAISYLQRQVHRLQKELDAANADLLRYAAAGLPIHAVGIPPPPPPPFTAGYGSDHHHQQQGHGGGGFSNQLSSVAYPSLLPWGDQGIDHHQSSRGGSADHHHHQGNM